MNILRNFKRLATERVLAFRLRKLRTVLISTGGTGGHIFPALCLAKEFVKMGKTVVFVSDRRIAKYSSVIAEHEEFSSDKFLIKILPVVSYSHSIVRFCATAPASFIMSMFYMFKYNPQKVLGFGSYAAFFPLLAGLITFRKVFLHEQNSVIGLVNKLFVPFASYIFVTFPKTDGIPKKFSDKVVHCGMPLLHSGLSTNVVVSIPTTMNKVSILITGGSQGSISLDELACPAVVKLAQACPDKVFLIYHQARANNVQDIEETYSLYGNIEYDVRPFFVNMLEVLSSSRLAVIRAGASSICEVAQHAIPSIVVPLARSKHNHQVKNAQFASASGACLTLQEPTANSDKLFAMLYGLLGDANLYSTVSASALALFPKHPVRSIMNRLLLSDMEYIGIIHLVKPANLLE